MNTIEHISLSNGFKCIHIVQIWSEGDGEREREFIIVHTYLYNIPMLIGHIFE
jgi:hypothetical protein